jgi:hypothetical protein
MNLSDTLSFVLVAMTPFLPLIVAVVMAALGHHCDMDD